MDEHQLMTLALKEAVMAAEEGDIPVGAIVVSPEGHVIGRGRNRRRIEHDPTAHAEIVALRQASLALQSWNLSGCSLVVTLEPCPMCAGAIVQSRISRLIYGCRDERGGACGSLYSIVRDQRLNHRCVVTEGILEEQCRLLLQKFFLQCRANRK